MKIEEILMNGEEVIYFSKSQKQARLVMLKFIIGMIILALILFFFIFYCVENNLNFKKYEIFLAVLIVLFITYMENKLKRKNERYYITNKRILKIYNDKVEEIQIYFLKDAKIINENKDLGDIIFSNTSLEGCIKSSSSIVEEVLEKRTNCEIIRFVGIKNPKEVLGKVLSIQSMYR